MGRHVLRTVDLSVPCWQFPAETARIQCRYRGPWSVVSVARSVVSYIKTLKDNYENPTHRVTDLDIRAQELGSGSVRVGRAHRVGQSFMPVKLMSTHTICATARYKIELLGFVGIEA